LLPVVGAKVLARDRAFSGFLNCGTVLNGDGPQSCSPLLNGRRGYAQRPSQIGLSPSLFTGFVGNIVYVHGLKFSTAKAKKQAMLNMYFYSIAI
jgi:hypothetical protein